MAYPLVAFSTLCSAATIAFPEGQASSYGDAPPQAADVVVGRPCARMLKKTYSRMASGDAALRPVEWIGSTREDLRAMPEEVQDVFGYALYEAQCGKHHPRAKLLKGDLRGLVELVDDFDGDTYRAIYTVKLAGVVYVLHVFQKKSTRGIATPQRDIAVIKARWQRAKQHYAAHFGSRD